MQKQKLIEAEFLKESQEANYKATKFFKTSPGQYSENDVFIGVRVPIIKTLVKKYRNLEPEIIINFLNSKINEHRLFALLCLVEKFQKSDEKLKENIYKIYLKNIDCVNNWNLVDSSAYNIIGAHIIDKDKSILFELANSNNLWHRRISIISTLYFIRKNQFDTTLKIAKILLHDKEDLIHKAVGWMIREISKKDFEVSINFIEKYYKIMPRTMLRYAIEKYPEKIRKKFLKK